MSTIHILSALLFILSACFLIAAERFKEDYENLSRKLAIGSLAAVFGAGVLFVMDVPKVGALMDPWNSPKQAKKKGGGGGADDDEEEEEAEDKGGGGGGGGRKATAAASNNGSKSGAAAGSGGRTAEGEGKAKKDEGFADCEICPKLIQIPAGSSFIGAEPTEKLASKAERPGRNVTIWPGFAIAQRPITVSQFKHFSDATGRPTHQCEVEDAAPGAVKAKPPAQTQASDQRPPDPPVTCISYDDASAYAAWLSQRTGTVYRLPTAAQWEFVARGAVDPSLKRTAAKMAEAKVAEAKLIKTKDDAQAETKPAADKGYPVHGMKSGVVEMVLDCWSDSLEILQDGAAGRNKPDCAERVLKGSVEGEEPRWSQPWSRRPLPITEQSADVGFRVVRMK